jgi:hypothetical protein
MIDLRPIVSTFYTGVMTNRKTIELCQNSLELIETNYSIAISTLENDVGLWHSGAGLTAFTHMPSDTLTRCECSKTIEKYFCWDIMIKNDPLKTILRNDFFIDVPNELCELIKLFGDNLTCRDTECGMALF